MTCCLVSIIIFLLIVVFGAYLKDQGYDYRKDDKDD